MKISLIGAGNVATHLGCALKAHDHQIIEVFSRQLENASKLAEELDAHPTDNLSQLNANVDLIIISVNDDALPQVSQSLPETNAIIAHTAGSISMDVLAFHKKHGVLYPFQTFSKDKKVNFKDIPILIEGNSSEVTESLQHVANSISNTIILASSQQRQQLHIAAVFACNFVNLQYAIAEDLLKKENLPFVLLLPLIQETAHKASQLSPQKSQTGPAVRRDQSVINKHKKQLENDPEMAQLYQLLTDTIQKKFK